ncbi:hypothetical protein [Fodinicola acaciae]|nr:hypothetical protein [Fodinicola acaciae]
MADTVARTADGARAATDRAAESVVRHSEDLGDRVADMGDLQR